MVSIGPCTFFPHVCVRTNYPKMSWLNIAFMDHFVIFHLIPFLAFFFVASSLWAESVQCLALKSWFSHSKSRYFVRFRHFITSSTVICRAGHPKTLVSCLANLFYSPLKRLGTLSSDFLFIVNEIGCFGFGWNAEVPISNCTNFRWPQI